MRPQYQIQRRGDARWVEAHGLARFEGAGRDRRAVSLVGTFADITERKEQEETLHLLMREVNHRARNMLSVVDAIACRTVAGSPEDYVWRFSERIRALAAYQDLLVQSDWKGVEIEDLVRAQLSHLAVLINSRIAIQGLKLRLNQASAQAIGLALHELATNAREVRGALLGNGLCQCLLGNRGRDSHDKLDGAPGAARVCTGAARIRRHGDERNGGAKPERQGRP